MWTLRLSIRHDSCRSQTVAVASHPSRSLLASEEGAEPNTIVMYWSNLLQNMSWETPSICQPLDRRRHHFLDTPHLSQEGRGRSRH